VPTQLGAAALEAPLEHEVVVKPTVSAGSRDTARFSPGEEDRARALAAAIEASGRTPMVQPYLPSVDVRGETALLFFGGSFSHAIHKGPILRPGEDPTTELFAAEEIAPREATAQERAVAERVLGFVDRDLLYARVDLVEDEDGRPRVLELELTEPSLFFEHAPDSASRFARAVNDLL
jgi:glutathione synthase/RimK-type ligase-like ATP-grasp enzyme